MQHIPIENYNYHLPDALIANYPPAERDASKLLVFSNNAIGADTFTAIKNYIPDKSLMVLNNTRVIQARLIFQKDTGALIEVFCLEPSAPSDYYQSFQQRKTCTWKCLVGNLKKWKGGTISLKTNINGDDVVLYAEKAATYNGFLEITFSWHNEAVSFADLLDEAGKTPIPPYLNRPSEAVDKLRYQTVYSRLLGSVAAPTAGLHFTEKVFASLRDKNIDIQYITLHVGAGTFRPVKTENAAQHEMHEEHFYADIDFLQKIMDHNNGITSVGTTSMRALESLYWIGVKLHGSQPNPFDIEQWDPYQLSAEVSVKVALGCIIHHLNAHKKSSFEARTRIMIVPGYTFRIVNRLVTNFHQPKSTLLLLVAAFVGQHNWPRIYNFAIANEFKFLSYGDSSLLIP